MGLSDALFTGMSGLDVNQVRLNVIGNNIANANTTAFKSSRTLFTPQFYVTDADGTAPTSNFGGSNPSQHGQGAVVATTEKNFTPGAIQPTGRSTDMAIDGNGFFIVKGNTQLYTRDGSFSLNSANQLVSSGGAFVQGFGVDANGNIQAGSLRNITIPLGTSTIAKATGNVAMQGNLNAAGIPAAGSSILLSQDLTTVGGAAAPATTTALTQLASASAPTTALFSAGQTFTLAGQKGSRSLPTSTFTVQAGSTVQDLMTFYKQGLGVDTNVPANASLPTPGVTLATGTAANSMHLIVTGNSGSQNALALPGNSFTGPGGVAPLAFADGANGTFTSNPTGESVHTSFEAFDSLGTPVTVDVTAVLENQSTAGNTWRFYVDSGDNKVGGLAVDNGTLTFDNNGKLIASTNTNVSIDRSGTGAGTPLSFKLNFGSMTQLTGQTSTLVMSSQDGSSMGTLTSFSVGADGTISGAYNNGQSRTVGQVAVANFSNPLGLDDRGGNLFAASANSGNAQITNPTQLGTGQLRGGALEQSNVDISTEFINMIVASTGFSAASRVITTSNQLITELLNSTR